MSKTDDAPTGVDLTKLIGQVNEAVSLGLEKCTAWDAERDEIVLALRERRVMTSNQCVGVRLGEKTRFNIVFYDGISGLGRGGYYDLDSAERILGYGGGE